MSGGRDGIGKEGLGRRPLGRTVENLAVRAREGPSVWLVDRWETHGWMDECSAELHCSCGGIRGWDPGFERAVMECSAFWVLACLCFDEFEGLSNHAPRKPTD